MPGDLPSRRIDREALERIIQRAAELQAGEMDTGESMTEAELLKLGADVGIDGRFLRQAMYEQAAGPLTDDRSLLGRWAGTKLVRAGRVVPGDRDQVTETIAQWMTDGEALAVKRRMPDRTVWERQRGFLAEMKRGFKVGGHQYHLARLHEVSTAVTQLEPGFCHVEMSADLSPTRAGHVGGAVGVTAFGLLGAAAFAAAGAAVFVPVAVAAVFAGAGYGIGRAHHNVVARAQLALEQVLDRLEQGEIKPRHKNVEPTPFFKFAVELRRAISEGIEQGQRRKLRP